MSRKTCNTCSYFVDDLENGAECGSINGCIYDKEEQKMSRKAEVANFEENLEGFKKEIDLDSMITEIKAGAYDLIVNELARFEVSSENVSDESIGILVEGICRGVDYCIYNIRKICEE